VTTRIYSNKIQIEEQNPGIELKDTSTGNDVAIVNSGGLKTVDPATGSEAPINGVTISSHAARHDRGGADAISWDTVSQLFDSGDVNASIGTGGSASRTTVYALPANWYNLLPLSVYMEVGGTVASSETVSISVKAVLSDGTEIEIASYSTTGTTGTKTETAPISELLAGLRSAAKNADGLRITSIVADVSSSATSTSASATIRIVGLRT